MSYGFCPKCNGVANTRERSPDGNTGCVNGHKFPHHETMLLVLRPSLGSLIDTPSKAHYAALRVALRNACYRVFGSSIPDVSPIFREIEKGMSIADATDALEVHLRALVEKEREDAQAVYKRPAR